MFKFLKDKIKSVVGSITKRVEEAEEKEKIEEPKVEKEEVKEKKGFVKKIKEKVTTKRISEDRFNELFYDLETVLLENNVAYEVVEKIKTDLKKQLVDKPITRGEVRKTIEETLKKSIKEILTVPKIDLLKFIKDIRKWNRPAIILVLGYNGSGKSLCVARMAKYLKDNGLKVILAAGDTFRAAGILQLVEYANKVEVPVIKHQMKGDSCAVIFDAINAAKSRNYDVVIADTAGRIHSNRDLMAELKKIVRVNKPDLNILVLDALTGTDIVEQAKQFDEAVGVDALIFTKVDIYEKGGGILSGTYMLRKPILFFGTGQLLTDLKEFDKEEVIENLGF